MDLQKKCGNRSAIEMIHTEKVTYGFLIGVFPLIKAVNSAGSCVFAAVGAGKAAMMRQLLGPEEFRIDYTAIYIYVLTFVNL